MANAETKKEVFELIKAGAEEYNFEAVPSDWYIAQIRDKSGSVNFAVTQESSYDLSALKVENRMTYSASIATMGGSPDVEELLMRAERIEAAAKLVFFLNACNIKYTINLKEEMERK